MLRRMRKQPASPNVFSNGFEQLHSPCRREALTRSAPSLTLPASQGREPWFMRLNAARNHAPDLARRIEPDLDESTT
jgi:hypothetical protein